MQSKDTTFSSYVFFIITTLLIGLIGGLVWTQQRGGAQQEHGRATSSLQQLIPMTYACGPESPCGGGSSSGSSSSGGGGGGNSCSGAVINGVCNPCDQQCNSSCESSCGTGFEIATENYCNTCSGSCAGTRCRAICGDGLIVSGEVCDGNDRAAQGLYCGNCVERVARCGDGITVGSAGEECDESGESTDTCNPFCQRPSCGDGYVNKDFSSGIIDECDLGSEKFDDEGNYTGGNSSQPNARCRTDCTYQICGDSITDNILGEFCDEGLTGGSFEFKEMMIYLLIGTKNQYSQITYFLT